MPTTYSKLIRNNINYSRDEAAGLNYDNSSSGLNATTVQGAIDEKAIEIGEVMNDKIDWVDFGALGYKNLIPFPYEDGMRKSQNGLLFTVNDDGSITITGTSTAATAFTLARSLTLPTGNYILNGDLDTETSSNTSAIVFNENNSSGTAHWNYGKDTPCSFTIGNYTVYNLRVRIASGKTVNQTFYPMIRKAEDPGDEYSHFGSSNVDLTINKAESEPYTILGARNFNSYPYYHTTRIDQGVTFTDNGDGTITATGKSTAE